jgi:hypothetical protein
VDRRGRQDRGGRHFLRKIPGVLDLKLARRVTVMTMSQHVEPRQGLALSPSGENATQCQA